MSDQKVKTLFNQAFTNVTDRAIASYQYYLEHDGDDQPNNPIDSMTVYGLYYQTHSHNDFDDYDGDAGTFNVPDEQTLLKSIKQYFSKGNHQIFLVSPTWLDQVQILYQNEIGIDIFKLIDQSTTPYNDGNHDLTYVSFYHIDSSQTPKLKQNLNEQFFGGVHQNTNAIDWFLNHFTL